MKQRNSPFVVGNTFLILIFKNKPDNLNPSPTRFKGDKKHAMLDIKTVGFQATKYGNNAEL
jgi:hypothetical protein